jgi:hypothetical protein
MLVFYPTACTVVNYSNTPSALDVAKDARECRRIPKRGLVIGRRLPSMTSVASPKLAAETTAS